VIMIERIFDPGVVNAVSNHWSIYPSICAGSKEPLDATPFMIDPRNVYLAGEFGIAIFHHIDDGQYEAHYRVLPQGRGKWARGMLYAALEWMFTHDEVKEIRCRVPRGNYPCRAIVRNICAQFVCTVPNGWVDEDGNVIEADIYSMPRERWSALVSSTVTSH